MPIAPCPDFVLVVATVGVSGILRVYSTRAIEPGDLPVEQPNTFEFAINLRTAKAMSLTIPQSVLLRANRVVE